MNACSLINGDILGCDIWFMGLKIGTNISLRTVGCRYRKLCQRTRLKPKHKASFKGLDWFQTIFLLLFLLLCSAAYVCASSILKKAFPSRCQDVRNDILSLLLHFINQMWVSRSNLTQQEGVIHEEQKTEDLGSPLRG